MNDEQKNRLDNLVSEKFPEYPRALAQKLIKNGHVQVNGKTVTKTGVKIKESDSINVDKTPLEVEKTPLDLKIIYEDKNVVVVDKPIGVLVHSKGSYNPETTLADWLKNRDHYSFDKESNRNGIVHRLDRVTSGVIICAKNPETLSLLQKQFQKRKTKKSYLAVVRGQVKPEEALIDLPIARNPKRPQFFRVDSKGKPSQTTYKILKKKGNYSLLELKPITGRTHQLRVHLNYIDLPIVGDYAYGGEKSDRLYLHAESLEITIPKSERKVFTSELPKEFEKYV